MKRMQKVLMVLLLFSLLAVPVQGVKAAETEYTYKVRFFSGAQGLINGNEVIVLDSLKYGQRISFSQRDVALKDGSKYYVKGIRESGKDNNTVSNMSSFTVSGDMDYVVVYGILGNAVAYTINYQDEDGNELAPSETYYGNVGDQPVVAYLYIEGYQPQAYNMTATLRENAADNVFTFTYTPTTEETPTAPPGTTPTTTPGTTPTQPAGGGAQEPTMAPPAAEGGGGTAVAAPAGGGAAATPAAPGGAGAPAADAGPVVEPIPDTPVPEAEGPDNLENLDDGEVPLADVGDGANGVAVGATDFATRLLNLPLAAKAGICSALVLLGGAGAWAVKNLKKRKVKND